MAPLVPANSVTSPDHPDPGAGSADTPQSEGPDIAVLKCDARRGHNPVLRKLSEAEVFTVGRRQYSQEKLRAKGVESLGIEERFERAGLTNEYESLYAFLSAEVHNNVSTLQSRYLDWDDEQAWVTQQREISKHQHHYERPCTLTMSEIVLRSTEKLLRRFGHGLAVLSDANSGLERISKIALAEDAQN